MKTQIEDYPKKEKAKTLISNKINVTLMVLTLCLFLLGGIVFPQIANEKLAGSSLLVSGAICIFFRSRIVSVINQQQKTTYTTLLPTLWGIGVIIIGGAMLTRLIEFSK